MKGNDARPGAWPGRAGRATSGPERGFSLVEAIVATLIATIAVMGLAYSFGNARGLVNRYETARVAFAAAQRRMESLQAAPAGSPDLAVLPQHGPQPVLVDGLTVCMESWSVTPFTDPASASSQGLKKVIVTVTWDAGGAADELQLARLFPAQ